MVMKIWEALRKLFCTYGCRKMNILNIKVIRIINEALWPNMEPIMIVRPIPLGLDDVKPTGILLDARLLRINI